jgi:hypothetical protein
VYCTESPSIGTRDHLDAAGRAADPAGLPVADRTAAIEERPVPALGDDVVGLRVPVRAVRIHGDGWPYGRVAGTEEPARLDLIPYHLWANRGPASMRVWLPSR